jgi:putative lipoic acid-binding regulatory protein
MEDINMWDSLDRIVKDQHKNHAIEFAQWIVTDCKRWEFDDDTPGHTILHSYKGEYHSIEELYELFLKEKC